MKAFRRVRGGGVSARFEPHEVVLLRGLIGQVVAMLGGAETGPPGWPDPDGAEGTVREPGGPDVSGMEALDPRELDALFGFGGPGESAGPAAPPEDPALARLLPDGYRDDPDAAGEFRRYTEQSLRSAKRESARIVLETLPAGGSVRLSEDQAEAWLRTLNDIRLTLGVRLEVTEEFEEQWVRLPPDDPRSAAFEMYGWLGYVQESLVEALM